MAILLVYNKDNFHVDPEKEYRGCYKKGYIVEVFEDSKPYSNPPADPWVIIQVTGVTKAQVEQYMAQWNRAVDYSIIARDVVQDGWRLEIKSTNANPSGKGHLTQDMVESYINGWNGNVVSFIDSGVRFDISIFLTATSDKFWSRSVAPLVFAETSYDQGTGIHRITADYGAVAVPQGMTLDAFEAQFARAVTENSGTIISNTGGVITFDLDRDVVIQKFRDDVKRTVENTICRRKLYFDPAYIDTVIAAGKVAIIDAATAQSHVLDRGAE